MSDESILITFITVVDDYVKFVNGFFLNLKDMINEPLINKILIRNNCTKSLELYSLFGQIDQIKKIHTDHSIKKYNVCDIKYDLCNQITTIHVMYLDQNVRIANLSFLIETYSKWALKVEDNVYYVKEEHINKFFYSTTIKKEKFFLAFNKSVISPENFAINFLNIDANKVMQEAIKRELEKK